VPLKNNLKMANKILKRIWIVILLSLTASWSYAQVDVDGLGQTIQINTYLHSYVGNPSWTLIIRDLDHDQNVPYLFDVTSGENHWVALTYGRNYLITVSNLSIETYRERRNTYRQYKLNDFCDIESNGRIIRGESMYITIEGDLSPDTSTFSCHVSTYPDGNFSIAKRPLRLLCKKMPRRNQIPSKPKVRRCNVQRGQGMMPL